MIEFYTMNNSTQFIIMPNGMYQNGELVAEGSIKILHLMFEEPALIEVLEDEHSTSTLLNLGKVTAVLPRQEVQKEEG